MRNHAHRKNMKKNNLKIILALLLAVLVLSMVACAPVDDPTPDPTPEPEQPEPVTFTVTFDTKGGTGVSGYENIEFGQMVSAPAVNPTKTGYLFDGWTLSNGDPVDFDTYTVYSNVTFYASWKAKSYNITAYLTDEMVKDNIIDFTGDTVSQYYGDNVTLADEKYNLRDTEVDGVTVKTVTFNLSYESTTSSGQTLPVPTTTKEGDRFMYWYYYEGETIVPITKTLVKGSTAQTVALLGGYNYDGARTLYAMWYSALENITVNFDGVIEGATVNVPSVIVKDGDYLVKPENPTATDYDFDKWTYVLLNKDEEEVVYDMAFYTDPSNHGTYVTSAMATDGVFTLSANWTKRIEISSASDLTGIDTTDKEVQSANFYLMQDVTIDSFVTLFDKENPFIGVFDGRGYAITINGLNLDGNNGYGALIGVNEGVIKSLNIYTTISVSGNLEGVTNVIIGAVAGENKGVISAVGVKSVNVSALATDCDIYMGGIAGVNYGEISGSTVATANIYINGRNVYAGGIVGHNARGFVNDVRVENCFMEVESIADTNAGFVAGKISLGNTKKCVVANSDLSVSATNSAYVGGIAGKVVNNLVEQCLIDNCSINADGNRAYAGGVVGEGGSTIRHTSLNAISVSASGVVRTAAGGFVGNNICEGGDRGLIQYSVATGTVSANSQGDIYVGGITGIQNAGASATNGAVAYVYAEIKVIAKVNEGGKINVGKSFGIYDDITVCYNVFVADNTALILNEVEYDKETKPFEVTTRTDVKEITPGFETIQNATWINTNLKLNGSSGNDGVWIVADGSYPTLAFAQ